MAENDGATTGTTDAEKAAAEADEKLKAAEAEVEKWRAMSRKHEGQAKSNADAAKKLKDAEDAQKSAEERAAARLSELEAKIAAADARALRAEVASAKGLSAAQAKRLQGTTVEELEADADDLLTSFKPADTAGEKDKQKESDTDAASGGKPKEALKGGATSDDFQPEPNLKDVLTAIPRA